MSIGLKRYTVQIVPYNKAWHQAFEEEKEVLIAIFKENYIEIEHIGSTSIPNMPAKPIIDIAVLVKDVTQFDKEIKHLMQLSYQERKARLQGKQLVFAKQKNEIVTHHLHITEKGEEDWESKISFRDKLQTNTKLAEEYAALKIKLADSFANERLKYTEGKNIFFQKILHL